MALVWSVPTSSGEDDRAWTNGEGKRIIAWGGSKPFWGVVLWYVFPSTYCPPPFAAVSDIEWQRLVGDAPILFKSQYVYAILFS